MDKSCLPRDLGFEPTRVMTIIPDMTPVLVG